MVSVDGYERIKRFLRVKQGLKKPLEMEKPG